VPSRSLPRFLLQAGFLVLVAAIAAVLHLGAWGIVVVMAGAFGAVVFAEWFMNRYGAARAPQQAAAPKAEPVPEAEPESEPQLLVAPLRMRPEPSPIPPPRFQTRAPTSPAVWPAQLPEAPVPKRAPKPAPAEPPSAPPPLPSPASAPQPAAAPPPPAPPPNPIAPSVIQRRRWNVFDLQNRASGIATTDPARHEEFMFLLLYLREFADVAGDLTEEFDGFVRESFPELVAAG